MRYIRVVDRGEIRYNTDVSGKQRRFSQRRPHCARTGRAVAGKTRRVALLIVIVLVLSMTVLGIGLSVDLESGPPEGPGNDAEARDAGRVLEVGAPRSVLGADARDDSGEPAVPALVRERVPDGDALPGFWRSGEPEAVVSALMEEMSDEERVAQVFLLGWQGVQPSDRIMDWIAERGLGGVKVFGWNADDLAVLNDSIRSMQAAALAGEHAVPLFTATDQEGGWIRHVRGSTSMTPGNMAIGATGMPDDAYRSGYFIGRELRALGINMNFAPTVDVYSNFDAHVIGSRAFSDDPLQTAVLGNAFYRGLEHNRVIATAKHFPGHGNASEDSHGVLPILDETIEDLRERDLVPYEYLIREGVPAVMSGHLSFPEIIEPGVPASLSRYFNTTLLREELGFDGLMITDDLQMSGARVYERRRGISFGRLALKALEAGADMVMLSQTPTLNGEVWRTVFNEYRNNDEFRAEIDASVRRILRTKLQYLRDADRVTLQPRDEHLAVRIPDQSGREFFFDHAARSVSVIKDDALPLSSERSNEVLLVGGNGWFLSEGRARLPDADTVRLSSSFYGVSAADRDAIRNRARNYDVIVFLLTSPATQELLELLREHEGTVVALSTLTPAYLAEHKWVDAAVAVYGIGRESFETGFATLLGEIEPSGRVPFSLPSGW